MRARILIIALASLSLLSVPALAGNNAHTSQHGFANSAGIGQTAGPYGSNNASISQKGAFNAAVTVQAAAWGGKNNSTTSQSGVGNVSVTSQSAW
jgi:Curlin associated repeat